MIDRTLSRFNTKSRSLRRRHEEKRGFNRRGLLAPRDARWERRQRLHSLRRPTAGVPAARCGVDPFGWTRAITSERSLQTRPWLQPRLTSYPSRVRVVSTKTAQLHVDVLARRPEAGVGRGGIGRSRKHQKLPEVFSTAPDSFSPTAHRAVPADAAVGSELFSSCRLRELRVFVLNRDTSLPSSAQGQGAGRPTNIRKAPFRRSSVVIPFPPRPPKLRTFRPGSQRGTSPQDRRPCARRHP